MRAKLPIALAFAFVLSLMGVSRAASFDDASFIKEAAIGGMFEVKAGKLASEKASDAEVKKFGEMMATDHGKAGDELKDLAVKRGWVLPHELDSKHQKKLDKLSALSGLDFDKAYIAEMKSDHKTDLDEFKKAAEKANDTDLRAWASKVLSTVDSHLKQVENIKVASK